MLLVRMWEIPIEAAILPRLSLTRALFFVLYPVESSPYVSGTYGTSTNVIWSGAGCTGDAYIVETKFQPGTIYRASYDNQKYFSDFLVEPVLVDTLSHSGDGFCGGWIDSDYYYPIYPNDPAITGVDNVPNFTGPFSREPMN